MEMVSKHDLTEKELLIFNSEYDKQKKDKLIVILLWFFLGTLGAQRFYLGDTKKGVLILLLGWATLFIWPLIDIFYSIKQLNQMNEEYEKNILSRIMKERVNVTQ